MNARILRNPRIGRVGLLGPLAVVSAILGACNDSGGGTSSPGSFQLQSISVPEGAIWQINKRIELEFSDAVDLGTVVAGSTLQLTSIDGSGAAAFWDVGYKIDPLTGAVDKQILVIQPFCPLLADLSDAGLQPGGIEYQLTVPKGGGGAASIKSLNGVPLNLTQIRHFTTPDSIVPSAVFFDTQIGPPAFVPALSFVRLGDGQEIPFVFSGTTHELPIELPLNLYSDAASQVEFLIQVNQAVSSAATNLNDDRVRIEYLDGTGTWLKFPTQVELEANCRLDKPGAILRLKPFGILPQGTQLRVTIVAGFSDIVGEQNLTDQTNFFSDTQAIAFTSLSPAAGGADELYEDFLVGGTSSGSLQDTTAEFGAPGAVWSGGKLTSALDFSGTGGPGGTFDWHAPFGTFNFSTDLQQLTGGPDGIAATQIQVVNGKVDVNDFVIPAGSYVRVLPGKNPLTITATGTVTIHGTLDVSGFDAKEVGTLFTPHLPETGAVGAAGGGTGGTASFLTSASTSVGGTGDGPFGLKNAGGFGGETGYSPSSDKQVRRGGGGGGGNFAATAGALAGIPSLLSLTATDGNDGHPSGLGALTGLAPPKGGKKGIGPFSDAFTSNNFFGQSAQYSLGILTGVTNGELGLRLAGFGGGAGGDSINSATFPTIPFGPPYKDKKGAGGGGGGGQVRIVALGKIIFKKGGRILCNGGIGNTGENVLGYDHIAGSSGGASGGHIFLESATQIDFTDGGLNQVAEQYVQAYGGDGGIGYLTGTPYSKGGDGGPGVVQLHVPDSNPATAVGSSADKPIRIPVLASLTDVTRPPGLVLVPTFGARSKARSVWIPIGGADFAPGGTLDPLHFKFDGTDALGTGEVETVSEAVAPLPAILGPETLGSAAPAPFVAVDGYTLVLSAASLAPLITDMGTPSLDIYLRNPSLLTNFQLRLQGAVAKNFDVSSATYSDAGGVLQVTADPAAGSLAAFVASQGGPAAVDYQLIPRFFRAQTGLVKDFIPDSAYVRVTFQATGLAIDGGPDEDSPLVDWTPDIAQFNAVPVGSLKFFRWEVEFNLDKLGAGLTEDTIPIALEFLRASFSF